MTLEPGSTLFNGKYRVVRLLGAGRFGTVYLVREEWPGLERAIKLLGTADDGVGTTVYDDQRLRFKLEYTLGALLNHDNIVRALTVEELGETVGLVLEYAAGGSLAQRLKAHGRLDLSEALGILRDTARGLRAMHGLDAIHRDVKPSNILLTSGGRAKIGDLGLAQVPGGPSRPSVLGDNALPHPGTPEYMSPEHRFAEWLQPTSDVYSLGCVAWEMLTGTVWRTVMHKVSSLKDRLPDSPDWLDALLRRMLAETPGIRSEDAADPAKRFVDMDGVLAAMDAGEGRGRSEHAKKASAEATADAVPSLHRSVELLDADRFAEAIAMLEALLASGKAPRSVESLLSDARQAQAEDAERQRIREDYLAITILARGKRTEVRALDDWQRFREENPTWDDDPADLAAWAGAHPLTVERVQRAEEARRQREADAASDAKRKLASEAKEAARRKADADAAAEAKRLAAAEAASETRRKAEAEAEAVRKAEEARKREAEATEERRRVAAKQKADADAAEAVRKAAAAALAKEPPPPPKPSAEQQQLLNQMLDIKTTATARAEAGRKLAALGDPRPGVGLRPDGLPDIAWCPVAAGTSPKRVADAAVPAFSIGKYLVTFAQFQAFVQAPDGFANSRWWQEPSKLAKRQSGPGTPAWPISNHPAERVSWYDAVAFTRWLTAKLRANGALQADQDIRLPTEQEWWLAATGDDAAREYPWGSAYHDGYANVDERGLLSFLRVGKLYLARTTAVGIYPQGLAPCGALDLAGNVWEWTLTEYDSKRSDDLTNGRPRVVRGGSWFINPDYARSSYRYDGAPDDRSDFVGFRVVRAAHVR